MHRNPPKRGLVMGKPWKMLAAVDLRQDAEDTVRQAFGFASAISADVEFVYVRTPGRPLTSNEPGWPPSALKPPTYAVDITRRVLFGSDPGDTIAAHADASNADIIWTARHRYGRWNR